MYIGEITHHNWMKFRGKTRLRLAAEVYGVTAQWAGKPNRSNWGGKTALLESILFVLFGWHHFRTDDEWITRGEKSGGVSCKLVVDDDEFVVIERTKSIGSATKLKVVRHAAALGETELKGDEAQAFIERSIGMNFADAQSTWYIGQKETSRFVTHRSGDRMDVVVGWLRLEPLEQAAQSVGAQLAQVLEEIAGLEGERRAVREAMTGVLQFHSIANDDAALENFADRIVAVEELCEKARAAAKLFETQLTEQKDAVKTFEDAAEYHRIVAEGQALRASVDKYFPTMMPEEKRLALKEEYEELLGDLGELEREVARKRQLASGEFDGVCPVGGIQCPATSTLNKAARENAYLLAEATGQYNAVAKKKAELKAQLEGAQEMLQQYAKDAHQRSRLVGEAKRLKPAADRAVKLREVEQSTAEFDFGQAQENLAKLETQRYGLHAAKQLVESQKRAFAKADRRLEELRSKAMLFREGQIILGRQGAQRDLAKTALDEMEEGANYALNQCGIDLGIKLEWAHEGKGLAKICDGCGAPFPKSEKVKVCERCGQERGPHVVNEFRIDLSDVSGAAGDLAGIAVNLAAADWFRRDRHAAWSMVVLDEPLAACDSDNAAAVAGHLPELLRHFGFQQAFIVSHSPSHVHACPALVEIEASTNGSKIVGGEDVTVDAVLRTDEGGDRRDAVGVPARVRQKKTRRALPNGTPVDQGGDGSASEREGDHPPAQRPARRRAQANRADPK